MKPSQILYVPKKKIAIASSFEGVVNNGAAECAFVSLNAQRRMIGRGELPGFAGFFKQQLSVGEFNKKNGEVHPRDWIKGSIPVRAFLALRPLVAVAGDYLNVLQITEKCRESAFVLVASHEMDSRMVDFFSRQFADMKSKTGKEREIFEREFYAVRKETQDRNYKEWLSLQGPFPHTIEQMRILNSLKSAQGNDFSGFVLYFVTSKDEQSTYQLCNVYGEMGFLREGEISNLTSPVEA